MIQPYPIIRLNMTICPAITSSCLYCLWNRIECHVTSFTGSSHGSRLVSILLLLVPGGLRRRCQARNYATRVLVISMRGCPCGERRCRLLFHRAYSPAATPSSHLHPPFFLPSSFLPPAAAFQPAQHTSPKEPAPFHPVSLGI